jgi:flavorubredoxin
MTDITEIAADIFRISTFVPEANVQFNQFLVRDEQPLLFHTGTRALFPLVRDAVSSVIPPESLQWIGFSHFEADECGALREWQQVAPQATAVCSIVAKLVSVDDVVAARPAQALENEQKLATGRYRFRFLQTPQVPHAWDAGLMYEETTGTLLCSDLFHHNGNVQPITTSDVVAPFREMLLAYEKGPFAHYLPYTPRTKPTLLRLAALRPKILATMHGSTFIGNGEQALLDLAQAMEDVLSKP